MATISFGALTFNGKITNGCSVEAFAPTMAVSTEKKDTVNGRPSTSIKGYELERRTATITLWRGWSGADIEAQLAKIRTVMMAKTAYPLYFAGAVQSSLPFLLLSCSIGEHTLDTKGRYVNAELTFEWEEFTPAAPATAGASGVSGLQADDAYKVSYPQSAEKAEIFKAVSGR